MTTPHTARGGPEVGPVPGEVYDSSGIALRLPDPAGTLGRSLPVDVNLQLITRSSPDGAGSRIQLDAIPIYERAAVAQIYTKKNGGYRAAVELLARIRTIATNADEPQRFADW